MSKEPDNVILRLLRDIRDKQDVHDTAFAEVNRRLDEVHETMYSAAGMAAHANIRHDGVADELKALRKRIEKLEENA